MISCVFRFVLYLFVSSYGFECVFGAEYERKSCKRMQVGRHMDRRRAGGRTDVRPHTSCVNHGSCMSFKYMFCVAFGRLQWRTCTVSFLIAFDTYSDRTIALRHCFVF